MRRAHVQKQRETTPITISMHSMPSGLWTKADSVTAYDDLEATAL